MYHHPRVLLLIGVLLLGFPSDWKIQAEDCIDLKVYASKVAGCCHNEPFVDAETFGSCFKTTVDQHTEENVQSVVCAFDCSYRQMGILHGEDEIDLETINTRQAAYDGAYQETVANAANYCTGGKDKLRQQAERVSTTCSSFAVKFHACLVMEIVLHCPAERWNDSPICEKINTHQDTFNTTCPTTSCDQVEIIKNPINKESLLLIGFLFFSVPSGWKILADECINLMDHGTEVIACCQHEDMVSSDVIENCFQAKDSNNSDKNIHLVSCAFDCVYREMGFLHGEDEIDVEKINMCQAAYDGAYQETIANAVDHCVAHKDKIHQQAKRVSTTCSSFAVKFHLCIGLQVVQNCPAERWNDGPICEKIRSGTPICKM